MKLPYNRVILQYGQYMKARPVPDIKPDSEFKAFIDAIYGPMEYGNPQRKTAAERYGHRVGAITATDKIYVTPEIDKICEKYPRAKNINFDKVKEIKKTSRVAERLDNFKNNRYKYYDYNLTKPIYTDRRYMYRF